MCKEVKRALKDDIIVLAVRYTCCKSTIQVVEMSSRGSCGVNRMDGESNENAHKKLVRLARVYEMQSGASDEAQHTEKV